MLGTDLASAHETIRKEFFRADKNKDMWREKAEHLSQTLQEIKDIAETYLTDCQGFKCDAMEEILQKITKEEEE
jgi:hypothetical protein